MQILESDRLGSNPAFATCTRFPHLLGAVPTSTLTLIGHVIELQKRFGMCVCFHSCHQSYLLDSWFLGPR